MHVRIFLPALMTALFLVMVLALGGCGEVALEKPSIADPQSGKPSVVVLAGNRVAYTEARQPCTEFSETRMPLFGDVHVHTNFSFDAAAKSIGATPADAHRFAKGEAIPFWPLDEDGRPVGEFKIDRPLDFLAVTDHGEFLGETRMCTEEGSPRYDSDVCRGYRMDQRQGMMILAEAITHEQPTRNKPICGDDGQLCLEYAKSPWQRMAAAAEEAYDKTSACSFTSFAAYEYTGTPNTSNYHRNVVFRNNNLPELPVSYIEAPYDSALWRELDKSCKREDNCDYLTIPHNSNLANGRMAPYMRLDQSKENKIAYALKRLQREPIMEIFQHKGASECINGLSSILGEPDELCDVEAVRFIGREESYVTTDVDGANVALVSKTEVTAECQSEVGGQGMLGAGCVDASDYLRSGLVVGLAEQLDTGANPIKLGVIAATDTHTATPGAVSESDWRGHVSVEASPEERLKPGLLTSGIDGNPGGLAGVWAKENSRDAIFNAMERREVFGTSGPRIVPRFFAGWGYEADMCEQADSIETAYAGGVPMGGDLSSDSAVKIPSFFAAVQADNASNATALQKLQLIKGWVGSDGSRHTKVITIAGDDGKQHKSLCSVFRDEDFDAALPSYYYLRAVEHPVKRWSVYDCERLAEAKRPAVCSDGSYPDTIQEMAWTSPIWYTPDS